MFTLDNFYKSREWTQLKDLLMQERTNEHGELICEDCGEPIRRRYDCIGHHEIELTPDNVNDFNISLNPANIKLIHFKCHNKRHQRFNGFTQKVYLVYGSPCSGKSSWVRDNANDDDLILDIDSIWLSICKAERFKKPGRLKANVFDIRDCIIEQIKYRMGNWRNAFIIGGYPLKSDRERLCILLRAEPVYIEASKEDCLKRAEAERPPEWKEYIEDWFDSFVE